jgi:hypothetical protein
VFPAGTIAFMKDFYTAIKSDPQLRGLPVLQTTLAQPANEKYGVQPRANLLGNLSPYADFGNSHNYFAFGEIPSTRILEEYNVLADKVTPGKPIVATEGGFRMGSWDGYKGNWEDGQSAVFNEAVQARYLTRFLLEHPYSLHPRSSTDSRNYPAIN